MLDDAVVANVAFHLGALAPHQRAVLLEGFDELQHTAQVVRSGFTQAFQTLVHHHGANAVVHINFQQQHAVYRERQDVAAFHTRFAGFHAILQIKTNVGGLRGRGLFGQQGFGHIQWHLRVDGVVFALWLVGSHTDARHFGDKDEFVGVQSDGHRGGHFFHGQVESFARG